MIPTGSWVKSTENPEYGVGQLIELNGETAKVRFPLGDRRLNVNKLDRVQFEVNSWVKIRTDGTEGIVESIETSPNQAYQYRIRVGSLRKIVSEASVEPNLTMEQRLKYGERYDARRFDLTSWAQALRWAHQYTEFSSLSNSRLEPHPHQVFVAHRATSESIYPRLILADEVGLGKTIEAGLILKELKAKGLAKRILIVAPASLVTQWRWEMETKFNERFAVYDSHRLRTLRADHPDRNPWEVNDQIVTSLQLVRQEDRAEQVADCLWDLVVFDEAHHVRRHLEGERIRKTQAYRLAEQVSDRTHSLLLLTATPLQLDQFELYSLVELLDPSLFRDFHDFRRHFEVELPRLRRISHQLKEYDNLDPVEKSSLKRNVKEVLGSSFKLDDDLVRQGVLNVHLPKRHRLSRVMIRNRKKNVLDEFIPRKAKVLEVPITEEELELYNLVRDYLRKTYQAAQEREDWTLGFVMVTFQKLLASSTAALRDSLQKRRSKLKDALEARNLMGRPFTEEGLNEESLDEEQMEKLLEYAGRFTDEELEEQIHWLDDLIRKTEEITVDSKARTLEIALDEIFSHNPRQKVLIFTQFKGTLKYLKHRLSKGYRVTEFHGGLTREQKDHSVTQFKRDGQVMISTEAGGEGRNFQFCHIMFNYDLPWNPMRIEQRIGRLDRIRQKHQVLIYNFSVVGTIEDRVLEVLQTRIRIFESTVGGLDPILGPMEKEIERIVFSKEAREAEEFEALARDLEERIRDAAQAEEKLDDLVMDTQSFRREKVDKLLGRKPPLTSKDLEKFIIHFLGEYGENTYSRAPDGRIQITLPPGLVSLLNRKLGKDLRDRYAGTFDVNEALQNEDWEFFAFGHELVDSIVELCFHEGFRADLSERLLVDDELAGFLGIQLNYRLCITGVTQRVKLLPIVLDVHGNYHPGLSKKVLWLPSVKLKWPFQFRGELMDQLAVKGEELAEKYREKEVEAFAHQNERNYEKMKEKRYRLHHVRMEGFRRAIRRYEEILDNLEGDQLRIAPVYRSNIKKKKEEMKSEEAELDEMLHELQQKRQPSSECNLVGIALVGVISQRQAGQIKRMKRRIG